MKIKGIGWVILAALVLVSCRGGESYIEESGSVFHTLYKIKYQASKVMTEEIDEELRAINLSLNPFNPNSVIAKVNNNEPVEIDDHFRTVFNKAMEISAHSNGMFDITAGPIINIWGFGTQTTEQPTPEKIDSILQFVGYRKVRIEGNHVVKDDPRIQLSTSAIAKGYACDVVAGMLERHGIKNYMVEIGGEVTAKGVNNQGQPWHVGIRKPEDSAATKQATLADIKEILNIKEKAGVATSGDYLNFYIKDGKKYAHTINTKTGYPAAQNILSCTIVADSCMTADGYATAMMAMGLEKAVQMGDSLNAFDYYLIYADEMGDFKAKYSFGMVKYLQNQH